jgi:DNA-directed RNA polymerase specialized sigma subunit
MSEKKYYLKNKDLYNEVVRCKELGLKQPSPELTRMFILLGNRIISKMYYESKEDNEDCFQNGILDLLKYWDRFDPKYLNAFAYYTQIFKNGMAKGWNRIHPKKNLYNVSIDSFTNEGGVHSL